MEGAEESLLLPVRGSGLRQHGEAAVTYLLLVSFVWAFSFPLIKGYLTGLDPNFVSFARMLLSLLVFLPFLRFRGIRSLWDSSWLLRAPFSSPHVHCLHHLLQFLPAHTIVLLTTTTPLFVTLFNDFYSASSMSSSLWPPPWLFWEERSLSTLTNLSAPASWGLSWCRFQTSPLPLPAILQTAFGKTLRVERSLRVRIPLSRRGHPDSPLLHVHDPVLAIQITAPQGLVLIYLGVIASGICFFLWNKGRGL